MIRILILFMRILLITYNTAVLPARPYKPKDKAKAENAVLVTERWILARLRNSMFVGLNKLNQAIRHLVDFLNNRPFKKLTGCRKSLFEEVDKPALRPLPLHPYEFTEFKKVRVHIDYHIELEGHYYSVPYNLIKKQIECRYTPKRIECWYNGKKIATHVRSYKKGGHTTLPEHMPKPICVTVNGLWVDSSIGQHKSVNSQPALQNIS